MLAARSTLSRPDLREARDAGLRSPDLRRMTTGRLFAWTRDELPGPWREEALETVVVINMPVARAVARRYRGRGCELQDLEQTACLALVRAVARFDPASGHDFLSFAVPTIRGEVLRHFRDVGWMVRPPRRLQELQPRVTAERLRVDPVSGHPLTTAQIAANLGVAVEEVRQAEQARGCFSPTSLDTPLGDASVRVLGDLLAQAGDPGYAAAEARALLGSVLGTLAARDRQLLQLRFVEELSQVQMAQALGLTQPAVSRLLQGVLDTLRRRLTTDVDTPQAS
jgi:RNA polymerase sigma-B factor